MAKTIITLGREYCTGGRYIAEDVANALGVKLYDKELITMAAKNSGLSSKYCVSIVGPETCAS